MLGSRPRILSRALLLVFGAGLGALTSFYLLLSVVPLYATSAGAGGNVAGLTTAALMFSTMAAELAVPAWWPGSGTGWCWRRACCCWARPRWR
jgi:hypothetical protein